MRQEPPVLSQPAPDARPRAAGPVALVDDRSRRFGQDHAPGGGMSMILTKAIFITFGIAVGGAGVVACFGSIEGVMIGVPLILLGFGCALGFAFGNAIAGDHDGGEVTDPLYDGDHRDGNYLATGESSLVLQITRGEARFADP